MERRFPWKRACVAAGLGLALCLLLAEFGAAVLLIGGVFGLSTAWVLGKAWWTARRERLDQERREAAREERRREELEVRREVCREARYRPEERNCLEDCLQQELGPIAAWDPGEEGDVLRIGEALIPPTEDLPFWKAVTVGAGACAVKTEGRGTLRAELMMALPPDWDSGDRRPCRMLRDAARRFLIVEGFLRCGSMYRGVSVLGGGFAGAIVDRAFPGLPEIAPVSLPGGGQPVRFYWLIPLLKPELNYVLRRGRGNLRRRFQAFRPWADPGRKPLADALAWFQEDIAPFAWSEDGERVCLGLETGEFHQDLFLQAGLSGTGWDWERLVREYLRWYQPSDGPFVEYACEERVFFAASEDREIMEQLALGLSDLLRDNRAGAWSLLAPDRRR